MLLLSQLLLLLSLIIFDAHLLILFLQRLNASTLPMLPQEITQISKGAKFGDDAWNGLSNGNAADDVEDVRMRSDGLHEGDFRQEDGDVVGVGAFFEGLDGDDGSLGL